jgi:hypothetical protein
MELVSAFLFRHESPFLKYGMICASHLRDRRRCISEQPSVSGKALSQISGDPGDLLTSLSPQCDADQKTTVLSF